MKNEVRTPGWFIKNVATQEWCTTQHFTDYIEALKFAQSRGKDWVPLPGAKITHD